MITFIKHHRILSISAITISLMLLVWSASLSKNSVEYISPKYGPVVEAIYGLGKVKTDHVYDVKLSVVKTVEKVYVREGSTVKKGDKLIRMEGGLLFNAPFDGTVTSIAFHEAQSVFPQQTVLRIEDLKDKYIEVSLEQQAALRVRNGQSVRVLFESIRGEQLGGKVEAVFPRNEEFLAHIRVEGLGDNVLPGMTADVAIEVGKKENVLLVPLSGISDGRIRVLRNEKKEIIELKIGNVDGSWAEVIEGDIAETDQIIVKRQP